MTSWRLVANEEAVGPGRRRAQTMPALVEVEQPTKAPDTSVPASPPIRVPPVIRVPSVLMDEHWPSFDQEREREKEREREREALLRERDRELRKQAQLNAARASGAQAIQSAIRQRQARAHVQRRKQGKRHDAAASKLQAQVRGARVRQEVTRSRRSAASASPSGFVELDDLYCGSSFTAYTSTSSSTAPLSPTMVPTQPLCA